MNPNNKKMKLTESQLRSIVREELSKVVESLGQVGDMHPMDAGKKIAEMLERETGRSADFIPANRSVSTARADLTNESVIIFEGKTQNIYISLEGGRGGIDAHLRTAEGDLLTSVGAYPASGADIRTTVSEITSALRDVGEL